MEALEEDFLDLNPDFVLDKPCGLGEQQWVTA